VKEFKKKNLLPLDCQKTCWSVQHQSIYSENLPTICILWVS